MSQIIKTNIAVNGNMQNNLIQTSCMDNNTTVKREAKNPALMFDFVPHRTINFLEFIISLS